MKRQTALILAVLLIVGVMLAACAPAATSAATSAPPAATQEATQAAAASNPPSETTAPAPATVGEPYNVIMSFLTLGTTQPDLQLVQDAVNKITSKETNTTVTLLPVSAGDRDQVFSLMLSSGEQLDLMMVIGGLGNYVNQKQLNTLDDLLASHGPDIVPALGDAAYLRGGMISGKLYAVLTEKYLGNCLGIAGSKAIFEKYGFDTSKKASYDDLEQLFLKVKDGEKIIPFPGASAAFFINYDTLGSSEGTGVLMNGGRTDTTIVNLFATDEYKTFVTTMRKWVDEGIIPKDAATTTDSAYDQVKAGKAFVNGSSKIPGFEAGQERDYGMPMSIVATVDPCIKTSNLQGTLWAIPITSKNPAAAMDFLNLTYKSEAVVNLLQNGIEGKHYVRTSNPTIITYPDGVTVKITGYANPLGLYGDKFKVYNWAPSDPKLNDEIKAWDKELRTNYASKALGYMFDSAPVKNEVAAIANVISQYQKALEMGSVDPNIALPEFNQKLKDAGIDKVIVENQKQLDAWLATQK